MNHRCFFVTGRAKQTGWSLGGGKKKPYKLTLAADAVYGRRPPFLQQPAPTPQLAANSERHRRHRFGVVVGRRTTDIAADGNFGLRGTRDGRPYSTAQQSGSFASSVLL